MRDLGKDLPQAHLAQTSITCRVTGEVMDEMNPPYYLPSGYLVSEKARSMIREQDPEGNDFLRCPVTKVLYKETELRKVFFS